MLEDVFVSNEEYESAIWLTPETVIGYQETYHPVLIQMTKDIRAKLKL